MENEKDRYGIPEFIQSICRIEDFGEDPIRLLGEFHLRAIQDSSFSIAMVAALERYIEKKGIKWND